MRYKIIAAILLTLILILPGSKAGFFNGLPLSALEIILAFLFFIAIIGTSWNKNTNIRKIVLSFLALFLVFQFLSFKFLPSGWSVCLHSDASVGKLTSNCEPSAESPSGERSFIYNDINFNQDNFPLYFINNSGSFNFFLKTEPRRSSLPFTLEAQTYIYPQAGDKLIVRAEKDITLKINDQELAYSAKDKNAALELIPDKINHIYLKYDTSRNKKNILKIQTPANNFYSDQHLLKTNFWVYAYKLLNWLLLAVLAICFVFSFVSKIQELKKKERYILSLFGIFLAIFFFLTNASVLNFKESLLLFSSILIFSPLYYILSNESSRKIILSFLFIILFLNSCIFTTINTSPKETILFSGGSDKLGHESYARNTFLATNFKQFVNSTEANTLYYYQPLHRYFLSFFHKILGEPMWGPYVAQTFIFSLAFILCVFTLYSLLGLFAPISFGLIYFILLFDKKTSALALLQTPYQQAIAFPFVVLAITQMLFLLKKTEVKWIGYFLLGLNLGAIFMMRTDWLPILPGVIVFLAFKFYRPKFKILSKTTLFSFFIGLIIFPALIGLRNYAVAGTFAIMPTSGLTNLLPEIKDALGEKIDFHEHSTIKFAVEITKSFRGHYIELVLILWNNIYDHIIRTSIVRQFLWFFAGIFSLFNIFYILKIRRWASSRALTILLTSFIPLVSVNSIFEQHNEIAMFAIYDFFVVIILAINIHILLSLPFINHYLSGISATINNKITRYYMEKLSSKKLSVFLQSKNPPTAGFVDRIKIGYRPYICPFVELLNLVPEQSSVFDIGCGSGMFLSLVSEFKKPKTLGGIEISDQLIGNARTILNDSASPVFLDVFNGLNIPTNIGEYEYIFLIDVLHHVPRKNQITFLKNIHDKMSIGSKLIFKDINAERTILSKFNKMHDLIFSGKTGNELKLKEIKTDLARIGFKILSIEEKRMFVYPHYTIACEKTA